MLLLYSFYEQVSTNGILSFEVNVRSGMPMSFNMTSEKIIAPFWADSSTTTSGNIYYRTFSTSEKTSKLQNIISSTFSISKLEFMQVFVATYDEIPFYMGQEFSIVSHLLFLFFFALMHKDQLLLVVITIV